MWHLGDRDRCALAASCEIGRGARPDTIPLCALADEHITATVPFARYDPYWIGPPEALPTTTRSISMQVNRAPMDALRMAAAIVRS